MPSTPTVFRWLKTHGAFREQYALARELQADLLLDEIVEIALTATDVPLARLQIDARKARIVALAPARYGRRVRSGGGRSSDWHF